MDYPEIPLEGHERNCWACSIPQLTWAKLALLNIQVSYNVNDRTVCLQHPSLFAAEIARQNAHARFARASRWTGGPVYQSPVKHTWRIGNWRGMDEAAWDKVTTEIAEEVMRYQYSFIP
jgi:hypothetical protein